MDTGTYTGNDLNVKVWNGSSDLCCPYNSLGPINDYLLNCPTIWSMVNTGVLECSSFHGSDQGNIGRKRYCKAQASAGLTSQKREAATNSNDPTLPTFYERSSSSRTEPLIVLNPMNYHRHGKEKANEAERWEEHLELGDPIGNTGRLGQTESHPTISNPGFGGPIPHHDRKLPGVPSLVEIDARTSEASMDNWMGNPFSHSSSSDWEIPSMPELLQVPPPSSQPTVEISPGVHVRLRGASETWKAIENDYYMPAECICCESTIFCIQNAVFVLCPDCRVVSRTEGVSSRGMGGVGLGFKYEDLARWQDAILKEQLSRHQRAQFK
jgi:hypothetical protein